jgi:shikimate dehydrogenase
MPRYAVIGDPIGHSLSPRLFGLLFAQEGVEATYEAVRVEAAALPAFVAEVRAGRYDGLSVTLPHKVSMAALVDELGPHAQQTGAVNCVTRGPDGRLVGANTDVAGLSAALGRTRWALRDRTARVLGAGGAARAAVMALLEVGVRSFEVANRTPARAVELAAVLQPAVRRHGATLRVLPDALTALPRGVVLVNATSVGLGDPSSSPLAAEVALGPGHHVVDLVYRPLQTALLRRAEACGAATLDGLWMLVEQALAQHSLWTDRPLDPGTAGVLHAMLAQELR